MSKTTAHIRPSFAPFYRRMGDAPVWFVRHLFRGRWLPALGALKMTLWALWPIRWALVEESPEMSSETYYLTANDAAMALVRRAKDSD